MFSSLVLAAITAHSAALPVQVATCEILRPAIVPQSGDSGGFDSIGSYKVHVRFTDLAAESITKIVFQLNDGTSVSDAGKFSTGVAIDHTLPIDASDATACAVQSILLVDGTQLAVAPKP